MIALATPRVAETIIGLSTLGVICRKIIRRAGVSLDCLDGDSGIAWDESVRQFNHKHGALWGRYQ